MPTKAKKQRAARAAHKKQQSKPHQARRDPTHGLEVANPHAAAIDIGASAHWVAAAKEPGQVEVRQFGCCTCDLEALVKWLKQCGVQTVVLEATGPYWVVLYDLLEENRLRPMVVNPRYAKNMSGKKGDISDCQWMQKLHTYGLFTNSFRPEEPIRQLRTYMRQRENLVGHLAQCIQYMQRALTEMNVQLANVISDISGETGLRIIDAILAGERDAAKLAALKDRRIEASLKVLSQALHGYWKEEWLFVLQQARVDYTHYQGQLRQCEERIQKQMRSLRSRLPMVKARPEAQAGKPPTPQPKVYHLKGVDFDLGAELERITGVDFTKVAGIGPVTAQVLLSEIGTDMTRWPDEHHFSSWLGLCPDHRITGGKILGRSTRPVVSRARNILRLAALSLERSKSALGAKYRRLKAKLGAPKAIVAMAHHLARLVYRLIRYGHEYVDIGMAQYEKKYREQRIKWVEKAAKELGMQVLPQEQHA